MEESCWTLLFVGRLEMVKVLVVVVVFCFFVGGWSDSVDGAPCVDAIISPGTIPVRVGCSVPDQQLSIAITKVE